MSLFRLTILTMSTLSEAAMATVHSSATLTEQAAGMPDDFRSHFFHSPLSARVMLDGKVLGDAMIMLTPENRASMIKFTDTTNSDYSENERQRWLQAFASPIPLGRCSKQCPTGLSAIDYSLSDARLVLITQRAGSKVADYWLTLPEQQSAGMLMKNQLNISADKHTSTLSWNGGIEAALNNVTTVSQFQYDHLSKNDASERYAVTSLYAQREMQQHFLRGGLFQPDSQGMLLQPYASVGGINTLVGVMASSSDALLKDISLPALFPVYVTANREGIAEIYRNGTLINAQPVVPGLQMLDTSPLPGGIYNVEIRILEDGRESSRITETINKPSQWRHPEQRLRYNVFAGQQKTLLNSDSSARSGELAAGASINWLVHPRATTGLALQKTGSKQQKGVSLNWLLNDTLQFYSNAGHSSQTGYATDVQGVLTHAHGNTALSHSRSWSRQHNIQQNSRSHPVNESSSTLTTTWRLNSENSVNSRLTHSSRRQGMGIDVGYSTRTTFGTHTVNWRLSGFDRPYRDEESLRNRGVSINASFSMGSDARSGGISIGNRTDNRGSRDIYASATLNQKWAEGQPLSSSSATLTADNHGTGFSSWNQFATPFAEGSFWGQRSTLDGGLSGGINTGSTLVLGGGRAIVSKMSPHHQGGGMIVDVASDETDARIMAFTSAGSVALQAGRNFVPVEAWKPGTVQLSFPGTEAPALKIMPEYIDFHHIRGGVSTHQVRVMKTVTVTGRLVDLQGKPLAGAYIINHAGRTLTESDGFFILELHEKNPVMSVEHHSGTRCELQLNPAKQRQNEVVFAGNLRCGKPPVGNTLPEQPRVTVDKISDIVKHV